MFGQVASSQTVCSLLLAQHGLDFAEAPGAVAGLDANPVGLLQRLVDRHDLDRNARGFELAFLLDAFFSHVVVSRCCSKC